MEFVGRTQTLVNTKKPRQTPPVRPSESDFLNYAKEAMAVDAGEDGVAELFSIGDLKVAKKVLRIGRGTATNVHSFPGGKDRKKDS